MSAPLTLVAGATGTLGRALVGELGRRGHRVRALSRSAAPVAGADETVRGDFSDPAVLRRACEGVDAVVSAAGASLALRLRPKSPTFQDVDRDGTQRLIAAAEDAGVRRFAYVSVFHTPEHAGLAYVDAHVAAEQALEASGLDAVVVRPTGFFDALTPLLTMAKVGLAAQIGDGQARSNPIACEDLAATVADALEAGTPLVEVGGPDVLSRRAMTAAAFEAVGRKPRTMTVRPATLETNARLVQRFDPRLADLLRFFARVSTTDCVAPAHGTRRLSDYFVRQAA